MSNNDFNIIEEFRLKGIVLVGFKLNKSIWLENITTYEFNENKVIKLRFVGKIDQSILRLISKLQHLIYLDLSNTEIIKLPESFSDLTSLKRINLKSNNIKKLPHGLNNLNLDRISLDNNPIMYKVLTEVSTLDASALISYLLLLQNNQSKYLNEAKILIVGDERVGKTSLVNRFIGNTFSTNQKTTEGISIQKYNLSNNIKVNIWDFAGQEITHQTHQFFLSKRSLYLYVLDAQKEDNDSSIYDWLETIKSTSDSSPIIVVINKSDNNNGYVFDEHRYKSDFPNIIDIVYVSAKENKNIKTLIQIIEFHIEKLGSVRDLLPLDWFAVKEELEKISSLGRDFIEGSEFESLCEVNNIHGEKNQETLLNILHDIGTIVCYRNEYANNMQILNPVWVTNAVYKIVRSKLFNNNAVLTLANFQEIFKHDDRYKKRHYAWILDLLLQFELALKINDTDILFPSKLPMEQPYYDLEKYKYGLNLRYKYSGRLKKGLISHFIVKIQRYISKSELVPYWKRGVLLEGNQCKTVVISNENKRIITISIDTDDKNGREFLSVIRDKFDEVNGYSQVVEEIPLIIDNNIVGYQEYRYLKELEMQNHKKVPLPIETKGGSGIHTFNISSLLDGYDLNKNNFFDYDKLKKDLIEVAMIESKNRNAIFKECEDETNDRFRNALEYKNYFVTDQSRGGDSESGKQSGIRDFIIKNHKGVDESVVEAFILTTFNKTVINNHYKKLIEKYDTVGNKVNFILIYAKIENFSRLWSKYIEFDGFSTFSDISDDENNKLNIKVGVSKENEQIIYHICINFYSDIK